MERGRLRAGRHRWYRPRGRGRAGPRHPGSGPSGDRRGRCRRARRRRSRRAAGRRCRVGPDPARWRSAGDRRGQQSRSSQRPRLHRRVPWPRAGGAAGPFRHPRARHRRPARRDRRRARRAAAAPRRRRSGSGCRDRPPERRQVLAGQRLRRLRPGDRLRHGRHHPGRDRHRTRRRQPPRDPGRHRRPAAALQGGGHGRLLRPVALRTRRRPRRRRARGLRRLRGDHLRGPASRRDGDERRLRQPAGDEQVGSQRDRHRRRPGPGGAQIAAAAGGDHLLGHARPQCRLAAAAGAGTGRPRSRADLDPGAEPLRRLGRRQDPASLAPRAAAAPVLRGPDRRAPAFGSRSRSTTAS